MKETGHIFNSGNEEGRVKMTSVFIFCISERKVMPLVRNGKLGRVKLHEAHALEPKLNSLIFLLVAMLGILYLPLRSSIHLSLYSVP